jgi:hypothetical protein
MLIEYKNSCQRKFFVPLFYSLVLAKAKKDAFDP